MTTSNVPKNLCIKVSLCILIPVTILTLLTAIFVLVLIILHFNRYDIIAEIRDNEDHEKGALGQPSPFLQLHKNKGTFQILPPCQTENKRGTLDKRASRQSLLASLSVSVVSCPPGHVSFGRLDCDVSSATEIHASEPGSTTNMAGQPKARGTAQQEGSLEQRLAEASGAEFLQLCMDKMLKIELIDGRDLYGRLTAVDRARNIILRDTQEVRRENPEDTARRIGTVLVKPGRYRKIRLIVENDDNQRDLQANAAQPQGAAQEEEKSFQQQLQEARGIDFLTLCLDKILYMKLNDGRDLYGRFTAVDHARNIILRDALQVLREDPRNTIRGLGIVQVNFGDVAEMELAIENDYLEMSLQAESVDTNVAQDQEGAGQEGTSQAGASQAGASQKGEKSFEQKLAEAEGVEFLQLCVDKLLKIELLDGRDLFGRLTSTDRARNIILRDTIEVWRNSKENTARNIGTVLVKPGRYKNIQLVIEPEGSQANATQGDQAQKEGKSFQQQLEEAEGAEFLELCVDKIMHIKLTDGRDLYGRFTATDRDQNIILRDTLEVDPKNTKRGLGIVLVTPGSFTKMELAIENDYLEMSLQTGNLDGNAAEPKGAAQGEEKPFEQKLEDAEGADFLQLCLDKILIIQLTDGRDLYGRFTATDREQNIILRDAIEVRREDPKNTIRGLGTVRVTRGNFTKIELAIETAYQQMSSQAGGSAGGNAAQESGKSLQEKLAEASGAEFLQLCMDKILKIELIDGRDLYGRLTSTDRAQNIILRDTLEVWRRDPKNRRDIGTTMVARGRFQRISLVLEE
uniref:Sm domain-containing protein n=1 Tax=Steinernema glaseri TaxID=37863 RepID=A0A1I7ZFM5_9BILA